jgi:hypothetical protein
MHVCLCAYKLGAGFDSQGEKVGTFNWQDRGESLVPVSLETVDCRKYDLLSEKVRQEEAMTATSRAKQKS